MCFCLTRYIFPLKWHPRYNLQNHNSIQEYQAYINWLTKKLQNQNSYYTSGERIKIDYQRKVSPKKKSKLCQNFQRSTFLSWRRCIELQFPPQLCKIIKHSPPSVGVKCTLQLPNELNCSNMPLFTDWVLVGPNKILNIVISNWGCHVSLTWKNFNPIPFLTSSPHPSSPTPSWK